MSSTTVVTNTFASVKAGLANLRQAGERTKQAAEYFKSVDTVELRLRGGIRVKESWQEGKFAFRTKVLQGDGSIKWVNAEAQCTEYKLRAFRFADVLDMTGKEPVIIGECLVAVTLRSYLNANGETIGVSTKNSRFNQSVFAGAEIVRAHGHMNNWEHMNNRGVKEATKVFNVNGLGLYNKPSQFARRQQEVLANIPDMEGLPEEE